MAELLIKAVDATHPNPTKDQRGCYKRGDVVMVLENGATPEGVTPPAQGGKFVIIRITDVTRAQVIAFCLRKWGCAPDGSEVDANRNPIRRRRIQIPISILPASVRNTLNNVGTYANTWANIRAYLTDKVTGTTATGEPI